MFPIYNSYVQKEGQGKSCTGEELRVSLQQMSSMSDINEIINKHQVHISY
jgi:hypothetical protein